MNAEPLPLLLASGSPRRHELLSRLGLHVEVVVPRVDEQPRPGEPPAVHALRVARAKALEVSRVRPHDPVLAADTTVALGGEIFGKPADQSEARAMLERLSGRSHMVFTAVAVCFRSRLATHLESARVTFVAAKAQLLDWYASTGEGIDKAGAYAVQGAGALLVERIDGNVQAVVGLPLSPLPSLFARVGLELRPEADRLALSLRA